ncbi:hypothetical protein NP233_g6467 [Leucocoprinus birnbaumii]|uniref:F-box domain-containing protein n=1 Tax=Leucocoprinus birnbaumii TaxID=56174 RepID=A0AAD5VR39_9AGAR|nr:hypothetical protein NP233_g6467 [Leucocoprinus birnbaumii]
MSPAVHHKLLNLVKKDDASENASTSAAPAVESSRRISGHFKRLNFLSILRSKHKPKPPRLSFEILPAELWFRILRYALRLTGAQAIDLNDPFDPEDVQEDYPNIHPGYFEDRRACRRVCRLFDSLVTEIMMEYIVLHTHAELEWTVKVLEAETFTDKYKRLGDWTTRIDFRISGQYDPDWMLRLFTLTPNLLIFTMDTGRNAEFPEHSMNPVIIKGLVDFHSQNIKRLDWAGMNDAPTYADLHFLTKNIRGLITLRMRHLYTLPSTQVSQPMLIFPSLKTLSLGLIPTTRRPDMDELRYPFFWDAFLMYLVGRPFQLSKLERFEVDICPFPEFFSMHGHKIRTFRTSSWSTQDCISGTFERLINLNTFHYIYHTAPDCHLPLYHPTLQRIAVIPRIEEYVEVPQHTYQSCIIKPLDNLMANVEDMNAKKLSEVRVCDRGAFTGIFESDDCLFWHWRRRLREYRNITLQNKSGDLDVRYAKYGNNPPDDPFYVIHARPAPANASAQPATSNPTTSATNQAPSTQVAGPSNTLPPTSNTQASANQLSTPNTQASSDQVSTPNTQASANLVSTANPPSNALASTSASTSVQPQPQI